MIKTRKEKEMFVSSLNGKFKDVNSFLLIDYKGLNVEEINELRRDLKKIESEYKVVKNTLTRLALNGLPFDDLSNYLQGPTALAMPFSQKTKMDETLVAMSKFLVTFAKTHKQLTIKAGLLNGKLIEPSGIEKLSKLPSREVLLSQLAGGLQAPIAGLVSTLNQLIAKLVYGLKAVMEKKQEEA